MAQVRKDKVQVEIEINGQKRVGQTISELQGQYKQLNRELRQLVIGSDEYNKKLAETKKVKGTLDEQRASLRSINNELSKSGGLFGKVTQGLKSIGPAIAAAFSIRAVVGFFDTVRTRAREIQADGRRFAIVFGEAADIVEDFGREAASSMGLTIDQFKGAAAAVGDLLIPMGFTREETANLTNETLQLAGALSEWTGGQYSAAEASEILNKAYLGEREQLKSLGISILEADVQQKLLEKGQKSLTGTALQQAKALATLELITEKSTDAQAAYADQTQNINRLEAQNTAAVQSRIDALANRLAPAYAKVLTIIGDLVGVQQNKQVPALERERVALNAAVFGITAYAEGTQERTTKIKELQQQYPSFLGSLQAETASNAQLRDRLDEVNQQYANRLFLISQNEQIKKTAEEVSKAYESQGEIIGKLNGIFANLREQGIGGIDFERSEFGFVDLDAIVVEGDIIGTYQKRVEAARTAVQRLFSPDDYEFQLIDDQLRIAAAGLEAYGSIAGESAGQLEKLKTQRDEFVNQFGLQEYLDDESEGLTTYTGKATESAEQIKDLTTELERLKIEVMQEGLAKRLALIDFEYSQQVAKLEGSAGQVAQATALLEEKRRQATLEALEADVDAREAIRAKDEADELSAKQQADQEKIAQLDTYHSERIAAITEQALLEAQAGGFVDEASAQKALQDRLLAQLQEYLEKRIALLESLGLDSSEAKTQLAELNLNKVFGPDEDGNSPENWIERIATATDVAGQVIGKFYDLEAANAQNAYNDQIDALNDAQAKELSSRNLTESQREAIETRFAVRRDAIDKKYREQERERAITQSLIDTALASVKALATPPAPNIPAAALAGVLGGIQTAIIAKQTYSTGGNLPMPGRTGITRGPSHSDGGIKLVDSQTGMIAGEVEGGETILSKTFTRNNPELVERALYSSMYQGGKRIYADGGVLTSVSTTPTPETIETAGQFNDERIVSALAEVNRNVKKINLKIGELEATQIYEMARQYETDTNATGL